MINESDRLRLLQTKNIDRFRNKVPANSKLTVYYSKKSGGYCNNGICCAMVPIDKVDSIQDIHLWNLVDQGVNCPPVFPQEENGKTVWTYYRYGNVLGIEPLIFKRKFNNLKRPSIEINEEFRLFHCLYYDEPNKKYIKIDEDGNDDVVAVIESGPINNQECEVSEDELIHIQIRMREIWEFLAIKKMILVIQFDFVEFFPHSIAQLKLSTDDNSKDSIPGENLTWALTFHDQAPEYCPGFSIFRGFSIFHGQKIIAPPQEIKNGMCDFVTKKSRKYAEFIIGIDDDGNEIMHTCNPDMLGGPFPDQNQNIPDFLTPVHFRRSVLDKYNNEPSKYTIDSCNLSCGTCWSLAIDKCHLDKVCVYLGDLGGNLSDNELLYWKSFNIPPDGSMSSEFTKQQLGAEFIYRSEQLDQCFKNYYLSLQNICDSRLQWQILRQLDAGDKHHLSSIQILASEEQKNFDNQVLSLSKILIDSLYKKKLITFINSDDFDPKTAGSIECLNKAFEHLNVSDYEDHIEFLRGLQSLRSTGGAHRKGKDYKKKMKKMELDDNNLITSYSEILKKSNQFLRFLKNIVQDGVFDPKDI